MSLVTKNLRIILFVGVCACVDLCALAHSKLRIGRLAVASSSLGERSCLICPPSESVKTARICDSQGLILVIMAVFNPLAMGD
jgi:hypothetical protein